MSSITTEVMGEVADLSVDRPEFKSVVFEEFADYLQVVDQKGRVYLIASFDGKWSVDCYQDEDHVYDGNSPTDTNNLDLPINTTEPALVVEAIANFVQGWDGTSGWNPDQEVEVA